MDLYNEAFRGTGKYGEEKISERMEPKAELALFNLFWIFIRKIGDTNRTEIYELLTKGDQRTV